MINYYIVRHGETEYNVAGRVQGWCDSPLTQNGIEQADEAGRKLADISFAYAACGDLGRHIETARRILSQNRSAHIPELHIDPCFRESSFGGFEEKPISQLLEIVSNFCNDDFSQFSELRKKYSLHEITDLVNHADQSQTAETANEISERFYRGLMDLAANAETYSARKDKDVNILIVTSGAVLPIFIEHIQKTGKLSTASRSITDVKNAEVFLLKYDGKVFDLK